MSGHSKWANIKHKKDKADAARGKIYTKIGREIAIAVKEGGSNPDSNSKLRDVIAKAKANNMPNDNISRSIKKAAGEMGSINYEEINYEGYSAGGLAIMVECLTDNRNRTASDIRHYFDKFGGNLGASGSVSWMFDRKGLIVVDYLQLMSPPQTRKDGNRAVEVGEISRGLKVLAKEMNMPVLSLSQLSRAVEQRGKIKRPMLSDLRESGSIEQDADIVMFIDRSMDEMEAESDERPELGAANLIVAKHRNGATRDITLSWSAENTAFGDYVDGSRYDDII